MKKLILAAAAALLLPFGAEAGEITAGSVPRTINYQGRLERDNAPITGAIHLYFRVYNHATNTGAGVCGGINQPCLWQSPEITVEATQGVFSATLEFSAAELLYVYSRAQTIYLEVQVESDVLSPREPMSSVAYALVAKKLEDGANVNFSTLTATYGVMLSTAPGAYMTVGTNDPYPTSRLTVSGDITLSNGGRIRFPDGSLLIDGFTGTNSGALISASNATIEAGTNILFGIPTVAAGEKARITTSGDLGVNTQAPMGRLDVNGSLYVGDEGIFDRVDTEVNVKEDLVVEGGQLRGIGDNYITLGETADTIIAGTNSADRLWLNSLGNLGVGASPPASERIYSNGNMRATAGVRGGSVSIGAYSNTWTGAANEVRAADATHLLLQQSNPYYVGIGTDTPREKLHVRGTMLADYGVRAATGVFTGDVFMNGNFTANGNNKQVYLTTTTVYGTLHVTGGIGSSAGFPAYLASSQTFSGTNIFDNQVEVSSDIFTVNRIGVGVTDFDFAGSKYLQIGDDKAEFSNDDALAYLVGGDNADAVLNFYRGGVESARLETQMGRNLALVVEGQTKTLTDKTYHRIQNSVVWISTGYASTPAIYVSSYMGNVGMGTPVLDPNWKLTVEGNLRISTMSSPGQSYGIIFADGTMLTSAGGGSATGLSNNSDAVIQSDADQSGSGSVLLRAGSLDGLILNSGGNVGIGTVNPVSKLNVRGGDLVLGTPVNPYSSNSQEDLIVGGNIVFDGALVQRSVAAVELSNLVVAGNVYLSTGASVTDARTGIGTIAPLQRLHVSLGDINLDSTYGLRVNNTAPSGWYLRGNGTKYQPSMLVATDIPASIARATTTITTTLPLAGGGDLSDHRTFSVGGLSTLGSANYVVGTNNGVTGWEYKQLTGSANEINITHTAGGIEIGIINPLIVDKGGTGVATLALNGVLYGNNAGAVQATVAGSQYQVLRANAAGVPVFGSINLDQAAAVTGVLPLANGGTGGLLTTTYGGTGANLSAGTIGDVPYFSAAGVIGYVDNGAANYLLQANGAAAPSWVLSTSANSNNTIVRRDASGDFSANTITANNFIGNVGGRARSIYNTVGGGNDYIRVEGDDTGFNSGYLEIATADDATEPIYVRQYTGEFVTVARTATLLDAGGNTSFPNTVSAAAFSGALTGSVTGNVTGSASLNLLKSGDTMSGALAMGNNNITGINSLGLTGARVTSGFFTSLTVTNAITGSVSGNAGTVTNGVYTTGSYSDPAWITALSANKITSGTLPVDRGGTGTTTFTAGVLHANGTNDFTTGGVVLTSEVTGVLPVANGGTGVAAAGTLNRVVCWKSATAIGYCSSVVAADGSCTCN